MALTKKFNDALLEEMTIFFSEIEKKKGYSASELIEEFSNHFSITSPPRPQKDRCVAILKNGVTSCSRKKQKNGKYCSIHSKKVIEKPFNVCLFIDKDKKTCGKEATTKSMCEEHKSFLSDDSSSE